MTKKTYRVHELRQKGGEKKNYPVYSVQYLAKKKKATRVLGPVSIAKLVGTMAQDSVQKKERQCKKKEIHIRKSRSNPEKKK